MLGGSERGCMRRSRSRATPLAPALGLGPRLASLLVGELLYRAAIELRYRHRLATFSAEPWRLVPDSPLIFRLREDHAGRIPLGEGGGSVPYRTNADGFRDAAREARR